MQFKTISAKKSWKVIFCRKSVNVLVDLLTAFYWHVLHGQFIDSVWSYIQVVFFFFLQLSALLMDSVDICFGICWRLGISSALCLWWKISFRLHSVNIFQVGLLMQLAATCFGKPEQELFVLLTFGDGDGELQLRVVITLIVARITFTATASRGCGSGGLRGSSSWPANWWHSLCQSPNAKASNYLIVLKGHQIYSSC